MRRAVIDVGSNSVLLLVSELKDGVWAPVHETSDVTGLGEGTKSTGLLGPRGMEGTLAAIARAYSEARALGAESIRAAATMAARIASNTAEFLELASAQGTPVFVLSGEEEAELGFLAVAGDPTFAMHPVLSIIDVGGHSTELVAARRESGGWTMTFHKSFAIGTLGLRSGVLADESPSGLDLLRAAGQIDEALGAPLKPGDAGAAIALGATGTNLVTIRERMTVWEPDRVDGAWLGYDEVSHAVGWMSRMTDAERAAIVGIERGRERTIHIGSLILERFLFSLRADGCFVSVRGWRHAFLERDP